jgi:RHS repeat-associated protein
MQFTGIGGGGSRTINHADWLGTVRLRSPLWGVPTLDVAYTPYGEAYDSFGTLTAENFTGDQQNLFAGLFDTPNRELDQTSGSRWLSPDPAGAGWNLYAYGTNPNSDIDRSGLFPEDQKTSPQTSDSACDSGATQQECTTPEPEPTTAGQPSGDPAQNQMQAVTVTSITQTNTKNADGTTTVVTTTTSATFSTEKGKEGTFLGANQSVNTMILGSDAKATIVSSTNTYNGNLGYGGAVKAMGAKAMAAGAEAALPGFAKQFATALGRDVYHHPFRTIGRAIAIGALTADPPTSLLGAGLAATGAAADLGESVQHATEEQ